VDWPLAFCIVGSTWAIAACFLQAARLSPWNLPGIVGNMKELISRVDELEKRYGEKP
jgi:hypothetical protein